MMGLSFIEEFSHIIDNETIIVVGSYYKALYRIYREPTKKDGFGS